MAKSEKMTSVSPFRLKYAREYYGLSHSDVIQKIKSINIDDLEKYEQGLDYPSYSRHYLNYITARCSSSFLKHLLMKRNLPLHFGASKNKVAKK